MKTKRESEMSGKGGLAVGEKKKGAQAF